MPLLLASAVLAASLAGCAPPRFADSPTAAHPLPAGSPDPSALAYAPVPMAIPDLASPPPILSPVGSPPDSDPPKFVPARKLPETAAPESGFSRLDRGWMTASDGTRLPLRVWLPCDCAAGLAARTNRALAAHGRAPVDPPPATSKDRLLPIRAAIVALHGIDDYSNAFAIPAPIWAKAGIATFAYDQRGFGANPQRGRWPGTATLEGDLRTALALVHRRLPGVPVYALGESMGGAVVLATVAGEAARPGVPAAERPDGIVLVAPAVWGRPTQPLLYRLALWFAARAIPGMSFTGAGLGVQASDNDPMLVALGRDGFFVKATRVDSIYGLMDLMDAGLAAASRDALPSLYLYGKHDELVPRNAVKDFLSRWPEDAEHRFAYYPNGWHMLLRDLDGASVARDIVAWIENHRAPLPSGQDRDARRRLGQETRDFEDD